MEAAVLNGLEVRTEATDRRFFLWMAGVFVLIAFGGFSLTYWGPMARGHFRAPVYPPAIVHIHGALLFTWTLFYFVQAVWVASNRVAVHRNWGLAGISLFTALLCSIVLLKIGVMRTDEARGYGDASRRFAAIIFCNLPLMIALFAAAIANIRRPDVHKRLMYSLMAGMMVPAIARVFQTLLSPSQGDAAPPPPFVVLPPTAVALLLIVIAIAYDWKSQRRWHPIYLYGGLAILLTNASAVLIAHTEAWLAIARALQGLAG